MPTAPRPASAPSLRRLVCLFRQQSPRGFTLTELLVVIGIITILIGITLPVVKKMRYAAFTADTQNEISQISSACSAYYSTFHAYPGPFSDDDMTGGAINTMPTGFGTGYGTPGNRPTLAFLYNNNTATYAAVSSDSHVATPWTLTGSQNLVLGLMGGVRLNPAIAAPNNLAFAPSEVGLGPLSLNAANPSRTPSFFPTGSNYLLWCQFVTASNSIVQTTGAYQNLNGSGRYMPAPFTDAAGASAFDCGIPVFVDRFPTQLPILYLRARVGAPGVVWSNFSSDNSSTDTTATPYQYDLREITPYTTSHIGLPALDSTGAANSHNLTAVGTTLVPPYSPTVHSNGLAYFWNSSITPTNNSSVAGVASTGRPRAVDQFILISAGPDGTYGTADDITSFGSVSQ